MQEIKDRIAEALKLKGKTPKQLSDLTGIPISSISQYMSGHVKPKQDRIYLICKALRINEAWLLGFDDVPMDKEIKHTEKCSIDLTEEEKNLLDKYRQLKPDGREMVNMILNREFQFLEYRRKMESIKNE